MHRLSAVLLSLPLLVACGGRPSMGWTSYSFERWTGSPVVWTVAGAPIWVFTGRLYRIDGDSVEQDRQASEAFVASFGGVDRYNLFGTALDDIFDAHNLYGTAPDDIWIDCALHFDGVSWRSYPDPTGPPSPCRGSSLYGSDPDRYFAVQVSSSGDYRQWDGAVWALRSLPPRPVPRAQPLAVHGSGRDDVHMVGRGSCLAHFDGKEWRLQEAPLPVDLRAVWARSSTEAYAGGSRAPLEDYSLPPDPGVLLAWDGSRWGQIASPTTEEIRHLAGDRDNLYLATDREVFERDGQGRWSKVFEMEEGRFIRHLYAAGGLLMLCDWVDLFVAESPSFREGIRLWVRR